MGAILLFVPFMIDCACIIFAKPELRVRPGFIAVVIVPSLPLFLGGMLLFRKAARMPE